MREVVEDSVEGLTAHAECLYLVQAPCKVCTLSVFSNVQGAARGHTIVGSSIRRSCRFRGGFYL